MKKLLLTKLGVVLSVILLAQTDVLPPVLISPAEAAVNQMPDAVLNWYPVAGVGPVSYEVQYDLDDNFPNPVINTVNFSSFKTADLLFGTIYYWRVRAIDNTGTSDWSETRHFTVFNKCEHVSPLNGAININPSHIISWKNKIGQALITGVTFYDWQVSPDEDFSTIKNSGTIADGNWVGTQQNYEATTSLLKFGTEYFWRVRTRHDIDTSDWSDAWSFTTKETCTLTAPANGATNQMIDITLTWQAISGAFDYLYEFCTDPTFSIPCMSITNTNSASPLGIMFGTTYYWRVKAYHTQDTSQWSDAWSFTTLNTLGLVSPANGSYVNDQFPTVSWQTITGTQGFELWYDITNGFDDPEIIYTEGNIYSYKVIDMLTMNQIYYWKVRAFNDGDTTLWSPTWNFTVGVQNVTELLSDKSISIYPNPAKESLTLQLNSNHFNAVEVKISNLLGQMVFNDKLIFDHQGATKTINLDLMDSGLYIIQIRTGESVLSRKIIIDK
ncbi:MAG: T9SS type A sorting domain-containing protein [Bacteroidales bacterium]